MIEAFIHKKLTSRQENMEDILTSNVFGMLQYVPPEIGLFRFLAKAIAIGKEDNREFPLKFLSDDQYSVSYQFWPRWQNPETDGSWLEPDVELHIQGGSGVSYLVCIEAKYHSGKSSVVEEIEEQAEEEATKKCSDQLAREWIALVDEARKQNSKPLLIYLTADFGCPNELINDSLLEHRSKHPDLLEPQINWLSWRELADLFDDAPDRSILQAIANLVKEMGLTFFRGISKVNPISVTWRFEAPPHKWQFQVSPISCQWRFEATKPDKMPEAWRFQIEPIDIGSRFQQTHFNGHFQVKRITCQWRFNGPTASWHFHAAPIVSKWRFER
jgi:hypothetical protein